MSKLISKNKEFNKPNELTKLKILSSQKLSLLDRKLYNSLLKKQYDNLAVNGLKTNDRLNNTIKLKLSNLSKTKTSTRWEDVRESLIRLQRIQVVSIDKNDRLKVFSPISEAIEENKPKTEYTIVFPNTLTEIMYKNKAFTPLNIITLNKFTSKYSIIMYELIKRYRNLKKDRFSISRKEFFKIFDVAEYYKTNFYDTKKRIIYPALKEINDKTKFKIEIEFKKEGRKVSEIIFSYKRKPKTSKELEERVEKEKQQLSKDMKKGKQKAGIGFKITKNIDDVGKNQADNITYKKDFFSNDKEDKNE